MVISIWFWNAEKLSPNSEAIALKAETKADSAFSSLEATYAKPVTTMPITRLAEKTFIMETKSGGISGATAAVATGSGGYNAEYAKVLAKTVIFKEADTDAVIKKRKVEIADSMIISADHAFFCEVVSSHPDRRTSVVGAVTDGLNCYARYYNRASVDFTHCPTTCGWILPADVPATDRVPKGIEIGNIRFCFWHAPSGKSGVEVAQMYAGLIKGGTNTVLFGDLNCTPLQLMALGIPEGHILCPKGPTRISGKCLDYALTNCRDRFNGIRALDPAPTSFDIKTYTGSDHMLMILDLKS